MNRNRDHRVSLSSHGASHYPRKPRREWDIGKVLDILPSGFYVVEWPWGIAFNSPSELRAER